jgi:iron complex outermembrane recepter protein
MQGNRMSRVLGPALGIALVATLPVSAPSVLAQERIVEEMIVTGTRIRRDDFTSPSPITVISGDSLRESGMANVGEALRQQIAAGTAGFAQTSNLNGGGATSIDLRNLGPERVLVLINGKRVATFTDSLANDAADLTFIPTAMVERVEILRDGASSVYGSDAISGVVNVILRRDFEGVDLGLVTGISGEGDGEQHGVSLTVGTTGDRGSLVMGAEFRKHSNIRQRDRDWAIPAISNLTGTTFGHGSIFSPGGLFFGDDGGLFCTGSKALGGDEVTDVAPNCEGFFSRSRDEILRYDYALQQDLMNGAEIFSISGFGNYELSPNATAFMETQFAKRQSDSQLDANPGSFGTPTFPQGSVIPATNPNNPTGEDGLFLFRPTSTLGPRSQRIESDTLRFVTGLEGELPSAFWFRDGWDYELSYLYTRVDADMVTNSTWNLARFIRISDPDLCAADAQCSNVVNPSGALDSLRPGNWTGAEIEYLRQNASARSEFQTTSLFGVITGPVADLPAGSLGVALGFETRREEGLNRPDSTTEAGESVANQVFTTQGSYSVDELFAEVDVPILRDVAFAESLSLNLQGRYFDYSNFGSDTVWAAGINWQVIPDVRVRAKAGTAFRAPTITDLFGGGTVSFDFFVDPCVAGAPERVPGSNVDQNCALDGVPATATQLSSQYAVLSGSNPNLEPETAETQTIGIVVTPSFLPGLAVSFDYWRIEVEDLIGRNTSNSILHACYEGPVGLAAPECQQFDRSPTNFTPQNFANRLSNLGDVRTKGFDWGATYGFGGPRDTRWRLNWQGTYVQENTFYPGQGGADDRGSIPRIKSNLRADVDWQQWSFAWQARYIHGMNDPRYDGNNPFNYSGVRSHTVSDVRLGYRWDNFNVLLGVNNVFDRDPPYVFASGNNTDVFLYDVIGRYMFLRIGMDM